MARGLGTTFLSAWEDLRAEPEEYRELDDERVLVLIRHRDAARQAAWNLADADEGRGALPRPRRQGRSGSSPTGTASEALEDLGLSE